jgi:O-antigen/teichoic acid export membrane protein
MADLREETKTIAKHSVVYMVANFLEKIVAFLMIPIYTRFLIPADYGVLELVSLTIDVIGMVISMGIASAMYRYYFEYKDEREKNEVISTSIIGFGIIALISLSIIALSSDLLAVKILKSHKYYYFLISFCSLWFNTILQMGYTYVRIKQQSMKYLAYSLSRLIMSLSLNIYFVVFMKIGVIGVLLSTLFTSIIFSFIIVSPIILKTQLRFSLEKARQLIRYGAPLIPVNVAAFIVHASDRFFINNYVGLSGTGIYSLGYKFGNIPNNFIAAPFMQIWEVRFFELFQEDGAGKVFGQIFTYLCFLLFFVGLGISAIIKETLVIISNPSYWDAWKIVPIIIISYIFFGFQYYFNMGIYFRKKTQYLAYINLSNAFLNIILNVIFIKSYGMWGAAFSTLACFVYKDIVTFLISNRLYKINIEIARILKMLALALSLYILCFFIHITSVYVALVIKSLIVLSFPIILFFSRILTVEEERMIKSGFMKIRSISANLITK